jgi:hypothetical protein
VSANNTNPFEQLVLSEVSGKNQAIHAYDGIIWKIRSGYLALLFAGWSILLKSIADSQQHSVRGFGAVVVAMFFFSVGLGLGGWFIDRSYVRRKHRVILALDRLTEAIKGCAGDIRNIPAEMLKVAGDAAEMPYDSKGYREAYRDSNCVFFVPLATLALAIGCIFILK